MKCMNNSTSNQKSSIRAKLCKKIVKMCQLLLLKIDLNQEKLFRNCQIDIEPRIVLGCSYQVTLKITKAHLVWVNFS